MTSPSLPFPQIPHLPGDLMPVRAALAWIGQALGRNGPICYRFLNVLVEQQGLPLLTVGGTRYFSPEVFRAWVAWKAEQTVQEMRAGKSSPGKRGRGRPRKHPLPTAI